MRLAPKPENDFARYIETYYEECRGRFPNIEAIAGKWTFRDLIPGMSDFDTRFIVADDMTVDDWCRMSDAVGDAHLHLCREFPVWARNVEHLPGINLTWSELVAERTYYPEYRQWTFYHTTQDDRLRDARDRLACRPWDIKDEYFHLKKFCLYYGRYDREIDPAVNPGVHENKYPLHSRLMHYLTPPVMSAVCILRRKPFAGKFDALEEATRMFPDLGCWKPVWEILEADYRTPRWYEEPHLTELEDLLEKALTDIAHRLRDVLTIVPKQVGVNVAAWKKALDEASVDPALIIFDNAKFSRLMKGRLRFYASVPANFDFVWLIRNELKRLGRNFFTVPFGIFWTLRTGERIEDPSGILDALDDLVTADEIACAREFHRLTPGTWQPGTERETALAIVEVFDGFFHALTKISDAALEESIQEGRRLRCSTTTRSTANCRRKVRLADRPRGRLPRRRFGGSSR